MSAEHANPIPSYLKVFFTLCLLTVLTVLAAEAVHFPASWGTPGDVLHVAIGVVIAIIKVVCVMYIFMHLKFDNPMLRFFVYVPVFLFCVMCFAFNFLEKFTYHH
jgi:caa(3)-type oxidase subunit IV